VDLIKTGKLQDQEIIEFKEKCSQLEKDLSDSQDAVKLKTKTMGEQCSKIERLNLKVAENETELKSKTSVVQKLKTELEKREGRIEGDIVAISTLK
jgi:chromosome condensin MukBEF ATPase and DNA-binding subunit MukB